MEKGQKDSQGNIFSYFNFQKNVQSQIINFNLKYCSHYVRFPMVSMAKKKAASSGTSSLILKRRPPRFGIEGRRGARRDSIKAPTGNSDGHHDGRRSILRERQRGGWTVIQKKFVSSLPHSREELKAGVDRRPLLRAVLHRYVRFCETTHIHGCQPCARIEVVGWFFRLLYLFIIAMGATCATYFIVEEYNNFTGDVVNLSHDRRQ